MPDGYYDGLDSNPDSDSDWLGSDSYADSRKKGWIRIQGRRGGFHGLDVPCPMTRNVAHMQLSIGEV